MCAQTGKPAQIRTSRAAAEDACRFLLFVIASVIVLKVKMRTLAVSARYDSLPSNNASCKSNYTICKQIKVWFENNVF